jgi:TATA-box binding protein (TBP) (component of TFIID and TFIIIB)
MSLTINSTPLIIRTMTITCKVNHTLNFDKICSNINLNDKILNLEHKKSDNIIYLKGKKEKPSKKLFYNQMTIEVLVDKKINKKINCKLFRNGVIHMTGCRNQLDAINSSSIIVNEIKRIDGYIKTNKTDKVEISDFKIHLINSNFKINKYVDQYSLYKTFIDSSGFKCEFNPERYHGVKIHYKHYKDTDVYDWNINDIKKWLQSIDCNICIPVFYKYNIDGKKLILLSHSILINMGIDNLNIRHKIITALNDKKFIKTITIFIFRTGQIIITGANCLKQLDHAYNYINDFIEKNKDKILVN